MINEGEFKTVKATNALWYENIDSCLTVTYAYDTGVPEGEQLNLIQMLHLLSYAICALQSAKVENLQ